MRRSKAFEAFPEAARAKPVRLFNDDENCYYNITKIYRYMVQVSKVTCIPKLLFCNLISLNLRAYEALANNIFDNKRTSQTFFSCTATNIFSVSVACDIIIYSCVVIL